MKSAFIKQHIKPTSVLFSDIRGFTTVTEQGAPEDIVAQLNEYFSRMVEVIFANHGTIDKFVGDMVMALFGAPLEDPAHAEHAVEAAQHGERQDHVLVLAALEGVADQVGDPGLLGGRLRQLIKVDLPGVAEERYLVVIDKVAATPPNYPRRVGVPSKKPL